jgi:hypothetical protein
MGDDVRVPVVPSAKIADTRQNHAFGTPCREILLILIVPLIIFSPTFEKIHAPPPWE